MFLTILAGVSVFVIGQFVLKLILEPIVSFKESLGALSAFCLRHTAKITNCAATPDDRKEMHLVISMILVKKQGIPFYQLPGYCGYRQSKTSSNRAERLTSSRRRW